MAKRRGRRTKRKFPVALVVILAIIAVIVVAVTIFIQRRNAPTTETVDLNRYYNLVAYTITDDDGDTTEYKAPAENEIAVVMDNEILNERAVLSNGEAYLRYRFVKDNIDSRFYYDTVNDRVLVTNATDLVVAHGGASEYTINGEAEALKNPVTVIHNDVVYLSEEFVDRFSSIRSAVFENPGRIYIQAQTGTIKKAEIAKDTEIREGGGNKKSIVTDIPQGTAVTVIDEVDGWTEIMDERGYLGYVVSNTLSNIHDEEVKSDYEEPEYTHISFGEPINMLWHGVFYFGQDMEIYNIAGAVDGINVISPRWFSLNNQFENYVQLLSNPEYMAYAHERGWKVWAMITDDEAERELAIEVLSDTDKRQMFIQAIMADALLEGIDGLNVDFEKVNSEYGDDFIQFIRELSIECRKAGIVLSVDNYTPYSYNAAFHIDQQNQCADYVVVMAYDHYVGSEEIGPNSSLDFLHEVMEVTLPQVDEERLIIGLPFYSRFWVNRGGDDLKNESHSMFEAQQILDALGIETTWNDETAMESANFEQDGAQVYAWVENARSIDKKLEFLSTFDIAGVSWWNLGQQTDDIWEVISKYY